MADTEHIVDYFKPLFFGGIINGSDVCHHRKFCGCVIFEKVEDWKYAGWTYAYA